MALGKSPNLDGPQFPHLKTEGIGLEWSLKSLFVIKKKLCEYKESEASDSEKGYLKINELSHHGKCSTYQRNDKTPALVKRIGPNDLADSQV